MGDIIWDMVGMEVNNFNTEPLKLYLGSGDKKS